MTALALAALAASLLAAQDTGTFRIETLAPGVHAALVVPNPSDYAFANSLVVTGDSAAMIVDTQQSPGAAEALLRALPELTDRPVRWIVNTHFHADHVFGNQVWKDAFPAARIVGHRSLRVDVPEHGRAFRDEQLEALPRAIAEREGWLADGEAAGRPLTEEDRAAVERGVALRRSYLAQLTGLRVLPPEVVVDDVLTVDLGGRTVRLEHVGPAHTSGDLLVHVPDAGVAAVGDLLEWGTPWLDGACVPGWVDALGRVRALGAERLLPSHGPVVGRSFLVLYEELLEAVAERGDLEPFRSRLAAVGVDVSGFDAFMRAAREGADGEPAGAPATEPCEGPVPGRDDTTGPVDPEALAAVVEAREIAFARSMADRDLEAFRSFVAEEAVFFNGNTPIRGREAVVEAWAPFFEGPEAPFSWTPDVVQVLDSGTLALSSGPVFGSDGRPTGRFNSVWRLEADGIWRVVFDKGS